MGPYSHPRPSRAESALNQPLQGAQGEDSVITILSSSDGNVAQLATEWMIFPKYESAATFSYKPVQCMDGIGGVGQ